MSLEISIVLYYKHLIALETTYGTWHFLRAWLDIRMSMLCRKMAGLISICPVMCALKARVILARSSTPIAERKREREHSVYRDPGYRFGDSWAESSLIPSPCSKLARKTSPRPNHVTRRGVARIFGKLNSFKKSDTSRKHLIGKLKRGNV